MSANHIRCIVDRQAYKFAQIKIILMLNLLDFLKDVLACCSVMHEDHFNKILIDVKFIATGPDEDRKLCYLRDVGGLINCNRKMFKSQ